MIQKFVTKNKQRMVLHRWVKTLFVWLVIWCSECEVGNSLSSSSSTLQSQSQSQSQSQVQQQRNAVVVGGGPVGIAAALTLASSKHNYNVTLIESSPASSDQSQYDPTKAFLYNVNPRGQVLTQQFPNLHQKLMERSVPSAGFANVRLTIVPADPNVEIEVPPVNDPPNNKDDKEQKDDTQQQQQQRKDELTSAKEGKAGNVGYWCPRHTMVQLMVECIEEHNAVNDCKIHYQQGQECVDVTPKSSSSSSGENEVCVTTRNVEDGTTTVHHATLVVGADGMRSKVRECLASSPKDRWDSYRGFRPNRFQLKQWTSPASHLRIKVLQLPPQFQIPNANGKPPIPTEGKNIYALRSINTGPRNYLSLGLLPMFDNNSVRPTNIVTRPDHEVWDIHDGPTMRQYFQQSFPRFDFHTLISNQEWDRFAKANGTRFPYCQYSQGMALWDHTGTCGVALVGDAIHAFPPDIGQGVNAGLMDVVCLDRALQGQSTLTAKPITSSSSSSLLKANLERYQKEHAPETAALIRLARFGSPYQYKQPHRIDRFRRKLWTANVVLRLLLNKLTFGLVQKHSILLSQDNNLTFRQLMRRADLTTLGLKTLTLSELFLFFRRFLPPTLFSFL